MKKARSIDLKFEGSADEALKTFLRRYSKGDCVVIEKTVSTKGVQPSVGHAVVELLIRFSNSPEAEMIRDVILKELLEIMVERGVKYFTTRKKKYEATKQGIDELKKNEVDGK